MTDNTKMVILCTALAMSATVISLLFDYATGWDGNWSAYIVFSLLISAAIGSATGFLVRFLPHDSDG